MEKSNFSSIFVIDEVEMVTTVIDLALMKKNIHTFTHDHTDCLHFIEDLRPEVLLLDIKTIAKDASRFFEGLSAGDYSSTIPILSFGNKNDLALLEGHLERFKGHINKPFEPMNMKKLIEAQIS